MKKEHRKRSGAMEVSPSDKKLKKSMDLDLEDGSLPFHPAAPKGQGGKSLTPILAISKGDYTIAVVESRVSVDDNEQISHDFGVKMIELSPSIIIILCQTGAMEHFDMIKKQFPYYGFCNQIVGNTIDEIAAVVANNIDKILAPFRDDQLEFECVLVGTTSTTHGVYNIEIPQNKKATTGRRISYILRKSQDGCWTNGSASHSLREYMRVNPLSGHLGSHYDLETYCKNCMEYAIKLDKYNCGGNILMTCFKRGRHEGVKSYFSVFENMNTRDNPKYQLISRKMKIIK